MRIMIVKSTMGKLLTMGGSAVVVALLALTLSEGTAAAYSWTKYTSTGQPTLTGTLARGTSSTPTVIPLAVAYYSGTLEYIWALSTGTGCFGTNCCDGTNNFPLWEDAFGSWNQVSYYVSGTEYPVCLRGVVQDGANTGLAFGWTDGGDIWDNESGTWHKDFSGYTSWATYGYTSFDDATSNSSSCNNSGDPQGPCLERFTPSGSWPGGSWAGWSPAWGAAMISIDPYSGADEIMVGKSGEPWGCVALVGCFQITSKTCTGSTLSFDAVAVNGSAGAFGLDTSGNIWVQATCSDNSTKWAQVGTKTGFDSVVTDNNTAVGAYLAWGTNGGDIWYAH